MKKTSILTLLMLLLGLQLYPQVFEVGYAPDLLKEKFTGNVLIYLSKENKAPKNIFVGLDLTPVYRVVVKNIDANEVVVFNDDAISYPVELSNIERGEYYVQAVFDLNNGEANIGTSTGNLYSKPIRVDLTKDFDAVFRIQADMVIEPVKFEESKFVKELSVKSELLSAFHKKDIFINAAVRLPEEYYSNLEAKYPVIYSVSGFGGNYKFYSSRSKSDITHLGDQPVIFVFLDGNCFEGHSTYANSDVNGPWGDALVTEFIPALNERYQTNNANFLSGHSSGGWTSLWLQINYPTVFSGAWASAPDQVDFRNYQNKNIYETKNMFYDESGNLLADVTIAGRFPVISAKDFYSTENVIYRGSQMHSFDAVFGGYDEAGNQIRLVNIPSGDINQDAISLWKRYDLSILLRENWSDMKDDLDNKIRISIGTSDNFHLHHAVKLLEGEMSKLNAKMVFDYYPGDHFTIFTEDYMAAGAKHLENCYKNWLIKNN